MSPTIPIGVGVLPQNVSWSAEQSISQLPNFGKLGLQPRFVGAIEAVVVSQWVPDSYRLEVRATQEKGLATSFLTFPLRAFREAGGNPFDIMRATQQHIDATATQRPLCAREELPYTPNPQREANLALRWTNGELARWISLLLAAVSRKEDGGCVARLHGTLEEALSVMEEGLFAVPVSQRARLTFGLGQLFPAELDSPYLRFITPGECPVPATPHEVDCAGRVVRGPELGNTASAYENWVLINLLHPGAGWIAQHREAAWDFARWLERPEECPLPPGLSAETAESVLAANQELITRGVAAWSPEKREELRGAASAWPNRPPFLDGLLVPPKAAGPAPGEAKPKGGGWLSRLFGKG
jgi:hypothetical protein